MMVNKLIQVDSSCLSYWLDNGNTDGWCHNYCHYYCQLASCNIHNHYSNDGGYMLILVHNNYWGRCHEASLLALFTNVTMIDS